MKNSDSRATLPASRSNRSTCLFLTRPPSPMSTPGPETHERSRLAQPPRPGGAPLQEISQLAGSKCVENVSPLEKCGRNTTPLTRHPALQIAAGALHQSWIAPQALRHPPIRSRAGAIDRLLVPPSHPGIIGASRRPTSTPEAKPRNARQQFGLLLRSMEERGERRLAFGSGSSEIGVRGSAFGVPRGSATCGTLCKVCHTA